MARVGLARRHKQHKVLTDWKTCLRQKLPWKADFKGGEAKGKKWVGEHRKDCLCAVYMCVSSNSGTQCRQWVSEDRKDCLCVVYMCVSSHNGTWCGPLLNAA